MARRAGEAALARELGVGWEIGRNWIQEGKKYSGFGLSVGFRVSAGFGFGDRFRPELKFGAGLGFKFGFRVWVPRHSTRTEPDPLPFLFPGIVPYWGT